MTVQLPEPLNLIGGSWVPAQSGRTLDVVAPSTGKVFTTIAASGASDIDAAVSSARHAFEEGAWGRMSAVQRGRIMIRISELITRDAEELAQVESLDTGKPISQARADMVAAARYFEFYGAAADKVHGEHIPFMQGYDVKVVREPHGVTGHIIPWNYPAQMVGRTLAPALAMGNATIMKPAEEACLTVLMIGKLAMEAGMPAGAINIVTGEGHVAGAALSEHPGIDFISFTGSPEVGVIIQTNAAKNFIGCTLELGGKSPQIVFEDADLDRVLPVLAGAIVQNGGQTCSAGSRALIQRSIWDKVVGRLAERFKELTAAPSEQDRELGALISGKQRDRVQAFISGTDSPLIARGKVATGSPEDGFYVAPALFGPCDPQSTLAQVEVFGPVLAAIPFDDEKEAIRIANGTEFGLVAGVWTLDGNRQQRVAKALRCGQVFINGYGAGGGIELPFGGRRKSGHGREKGFAALHEFSTIKTIVHNHG
ncbi:aldehyde dehydrogenase family protein [Mesorhizobium sp. VNQ89]|uniref:aldehyde dehydrogenase family protein n=1 Tax=Mesorhizobium quangtriensis TaxID=3157709 RepID=UPI0032B7EB32